VAGVLGGVVAGSGWASPSQSDGIWGGQAEGFWPGTGGINAKAQRGKRRNQKI